MNDSCIFCKIIAKQIPSTIIHENDDILVIKDLYPKAPIHYLILPKLHAKDVQSLADTDMHVANALFQAAKDLSVKEGGKDFKLVINSGAASGQTIFHLHMHFVAGKRLGEI